MKGMTVYIYKNATFAGCSNDGISSRCNEVTLIGDGIPQMWEPSTDKPAVRLEKGPYDSVRAVPVDQPANSMGPMNGGAFISCSDSRFCSAIKKLLGKDFYGAVPLHDRFETAEEYKRYSA